jgi:very-short-patch-repair endonuclease
VARSPEGRAARSAQSKALWANPEAAKALVEKNTRIARSESGRRQRSEQSKKAWENPDFRNRIVSEATDRLKSETHRKLVSDRNRRQYAEDPAGYIETRVAPLHTAEAKRKHQKALQNPEYKETHRRLALKRFQNLEYKEKISAGVERFAKSGKKSKPEKFVDGVLQYLGVESVSQKSVGPYNFDFYVHEHDLYIEVQGDYWHSLKNNVRRDKAKYSYFRKAFPDSTLLYVWEHETLIPRLVEKKISAAIGKQVETQDFSLLDVSIKEVDALESKEFLEMWHYSQFGRHGKKIFGAFLGDELIGVCKFSAPVRAECSSCMGMEPQSVIELDRFCIKPTRQKKNFGSWMISRCASMAFCAFPRVSRIIAFSDLTYGHTGSIYKASNWTEVSRVAPDYVYVNENGWMMHKKTLYNQARGCHMTEKEFAEAKGFKKVFGKEKIKFAIDRNL